MTDLADVPLTTLAGEPARLADWAGQVLLIVNVASRCGLTPQYAGLQALHAKYKEEGLAVLGFPSNDFAGQEPADEAEIAEFCSNSYQVTFPMFAKVSTTGPDKHPLYAALIAALPQAGGSGAMRARLEKGGFPVRPEPELLWNFEKFLVGRDGQPVARFSPDTTPDDPGLVQAVERELFASE
jgi:glutathione peroxidase